MSTQLKSHVSLEQRVCIVCGKSYDTNTLLLDRRLQPTLDHHTVTGWGMCDEHQEMSDQAYIALIEINPSKSGPTSDTLKPEDAYRTGRFCHIRESAFKLIFNVPVPPKKVAFVDDVVITRIQQIAEVQP